MVGGKENEGAMNDGALIAETMSNISSGYNGRIGNNTKCGRVYSTE